MKKPYYEVQVRHVIDGVRTQWWRHCRVESESVAQDVIRRWDGHEFEVPHEFRIRPLPLQIDRPTVHCTIADDPYLRGRSYVSLHKDGKGQPVPVLDFGNKKSQKKLRRISRRNASFPR